MKKNRLIAGIVVLLFICIAIFLPSINDIYNTTSKEIKDNLFKQKYLYKNTLFDLNNGYIYSFERNDGTVKNIYTNEQNAFEYLIKDDMFAIRDVGDAKYDVYEMELYEDRIRIKVDKENNIDLFFKTNQDKEFVEFIFVESSDGKCLNDINANEITFFNDNKAIINTDKGALQFEYSIDEKILTLINQQSIYHFIAIGQNQMENYDESLLGLYLSLDINNKFELNEDNGYLEIDNEACEFIYGVYGRYILCENELGNKFILDYTFENDILEIKILPFEKENDEIYTFTKVS